MGSINFIIILDICWVGYIVDDHERVAVDLQLSGLIGGSYDTYWHVLYS